MSNQTLKTEEEVLKYWLDNQMFEKSLELNKDGPTYVFYDGPPFATGLPHYGHILASTLKDTVCRYWCQMGWSVPRRFGWDTHGLPIEYEIEKELGIKTREEVEKLGIANYNEECRKIVLRYRDEWRSRITRLGRWIDFDNDYKTMDPKFMESVWWVFSELWKKDLVYQGVKVMPYSTACHTPLSNFEAKSNYKEVDDPSVIIKFELVLTPALTDLLCLSSKSTSESTSESSMQAPPKVYLLVWTTTPWTLLSNLAICLNPTAQYVCVKQTLEESEEPSYYILGQQALSNIFPQPKSSKKAKEPTKETTNVEILSTFPGKELLNDNYVPLFDCFKDRFPDAFKILGDSYVKASNQESEESLKDEDQNASSSSGAGTGLVHQAPAFGEDDFRVCTNNKLVGRKVWPPCPIDDNGCFTNEVPAPFTNLYFKDCDPVVIKNLKSRNLLFSHKTMKHKYPYCWRSDTPLIYRVVTAWFVDVISLKDKLLKNNAQINWVPDFIGKRKFADWLNHCVDWCVSRNRYWGTPIPIWTSQGTSTSSTNVSDKASNASQEASNNSHVVSKGASQEDVNKALREEDPEYICIESVEQLETLANLPKGTIKDLHSHNIDHITFKSPKTGKPMKRIAECLDCWFESGSMPYAQAHYPFENKEEFEKNFPCDFIAEGTDQTRGWFYTLLVLSTALFDKPAFKNVIVNGLILAEDGEKMSKRKKNYPEPTLIMDKYGSDALRLYLLDSKVVKADSLRFQEAGVKIVKKNVLIMIENMLQYRQETVEFFERQSGKTYETLRVLFSPDTVSGVTQSFEKESKKESQNLSNLTESESLNLEELTNPLDSWIFHCLEDLLTGVHKHLRTYDLSNVLSLIEVFVDRLSRWWIKLNKTRLRLPLRPDPKDIHDVQVGLSVLDYCLYNMSLGLAPFAPFISEVVFQRIRPFINWGFGKENTKGSEDSENSSKNTEGNENTEGSSEGSSQKAEVKTLSVHFNAIPNQLTFTRSPTMIKSMETLITILGLIRTLRTKRSGNTSIKMPYSKCIVLHSDPAVLEALKQVEDLLSIQSNLLSVSYGSDTQTYLDYHVKPNMKILGPKLGKNLKDFCGFLTSMNQDDPKRVHELLSNPNESFKYLQYEIEVSTDLEVFSELKPNVSSYQVDKAGDLIVLLDPEISDELEEKYMVKLVCRKLQEFRRNLGLKLGDEAYFLATKVVDNGEDTIVEGENTVKSEGGKLLFMNKVVHIHQKIFNEYVGNILTDRARLPSDLKEKSSTIVELDSESIQFTLYS